MKAVVFAVLLVAVLWLLVVVGARILEGDACDQLRAQPATEAFILSVCGR